MAVGKVVNRAEILGGDIQLAWDMLHRIQNIGVSQFCFIVARLYHGFIPNSCGLGILKMPCRFNNSLR